MKKTLFLFLLIFSFCNDQFAQDNISLQINTGPMFVTNTENNHLKINSHTGYNIAFTFLYSISNNFDITLKGSYLSWSSKERFYNWHFGDLENKTTLRYSYDGENESLTFLAGIRYYFRTDFIDPYLSIEFGRSSYSTELTNKTFYDNDYISRVNSNPKKKNGVSLGFSAGTKIKLTKKFNIDINITTIAPQYFPEYYLVTCGFDMKLSSIF